jgi:hypothetical protein
MTDLTRDAVLRSLADHLVAALDWQVTDSARPDHGGLIRPEWGIAQAGGAAGWLAGCALVWLGGGADEATRRELLARASPVADYLLRAQRPSGLIDLLDCNYDSSPDTGFAVQLLCAALEVGHKLPSDDPEWRHLAGRLEQFACRAVGGMLAGGFHTPNHRWVLASALAQAGALWPDLPVEPTIAAYLAEGIDIDPEGAYIERSVGVYDAVCDRSLLLLAEHRPADAPALRAAVRANLDFDLHLLHADGSAETGLSHRQDYGTRVVPTTLVAPLLHSALRDPDPHLARAARWLWRQGTPSLPDCLWLAYVLLAHGEPAPGEAGLPADFARHFPHNGLWRARRGALSVTAFRGVPRLLALRHGAAELSGVSIHQSYFSQASGRFIGDELAGEGERAILHSRGQADPRRPGYEQPLGRAVPPERWTDLLPERDLRRLPPAASELAAELVPGGLDLRYRTLDGMSGVVAQVAFDFPPGGTWETGDTSLRPVAGQTIFLKRGHGVMRYGTDTIRLGPGNDAHRTWQMRHTEPPTGHVRVLLPFLTPVEHTFEIRVGRGL